MPNVVIYTTEYCPFCIRARRLLDKKGVAYTDHRIDSHPELRQEMEKLANGCSSVPQIFIDELHVGGFDDMVELDMDGGLDRHLGL